MAKALTNVKLNIEVDAAGVPQRAFAKYRVEDGAAGKNDDMVVDTPDFTKTVHNTGVAGELWFDVVAAIKTKEGI